jgi:hypothetical protein
MMPDGRRHAVALLVGATADEWTPMGGGMSLDAAAFRLTSPPPATQMAQDCGAGQPTTGWMQR